MSFPQFPLVVVVGAIMILVCAIERGSSVISVGCWVLVPVSSIIIGGRASGEGPGSCSVVTLLPLLWSLPWSLSLSWIELALLRRWWSFLSLLAASTHDPPCEQWLTGLWAGAGLSIIHCHCGELGRVLGCSSSLWDPGACF